SFLALATSQKPRQFAKKSRGSRPVFLLSHPSSKSAKQELRQASTSGCTAGSASESSSTRASIVRGRREPGDQGLRLTPVVRQRVARRKSHIKARVTECLDQVSPCERGALVFQVQHNALARLDIRTPQRLENPPLLEPVFHPRR